jgi:mRNA interferase MazF
MKPSEIYLGRFPFGDVAGMKLRPVLVLSEVVGPASEVLVAYASSVLPEVTLPTDIVLDPMLPRDRATNLKVLSVLRLHKLATIHKASLVRHLGSLSPETYALAHTRLRDWLKI